MVGLALIGAAVATAFLAAAAVRIRSVVSTLLVAYLAYVANLGLVTLVLSPFHEVTRTGVAVAEGVLLLAAFTAWWLRGHAGPPLAPARDALREAASDPVTVLFVVVVVVLLGYEAVLAAAPPNNMDSLTYHLTRAAAWAQHGGIYWIANAPEVELNAYQPFAELEHFFLMVATGGGRLYALPQYLAELAIVVSVYGSARRLGYAVRPSTCAAALTATFSIVALEAVTGQTTCSRRPSPPWRPASCSGPPAPRPPSPAPWSRSEPARAASAPAVPSRRQAATAGKDAADRSYCTVTASSATIEKVAVSAAAHVRGPRRVAEAPGRSVHGDDDRELREVLRQGGGPSAARREP